MSKKYAGLCLLLALLLLCGCSMPTALGSRLFVENAGVDQTENGILLSLNTFLADLKTEAGNGEFQIQNGFSITEAMERIARKTGREPYFPHNCAVVIGRAAAEQGIGGILRFFTDFSGCRGGVPLFMADNTAAEVLQYVSESTLLDARALNELTDDERLVGRTVYMPLYRAAAAGVNGTPDLCIPVLRVMNETVTVSGTAVFRDGRLIAQLDENQTVGLQLITGDLKQTLIHCAIPNYGRATLSVHVEKSEIYMDGNASDGFSVALDASCTVRLFESDFSAAVRADDPLLNQRMQEVCVDQLTEWVQTAVRRVCAAGADPFGFGVYLRTADPNMWQTVRAEWRDILRRSRFSTQIEVTVQHA